MACRITVISPFLAAAFALEEVFLTPASSRGRAASAQSQKNTSMRTKRPNHPRAIPREICEGKRTQGTLAEGHLCVYPSMLSYIHTHIIIYHDIYIYIYT